MIEAFHINNQRIYFTPQDLSPQNIQNHKQNANKGTFICPYCQAKLSFRRRPDRRNFFKQFIFTFYFLETSVQEKIN